MISYKNMTLYILMISSFMPITSQKYGYSYSDLVHSIFGSQSFEKRGSPNLFPLEGYWAIDDEFCSDDTLRVRYVLVNINDTSSKYHYSTLKLKKKCRKDDRRSVYIINEFLFEQSNAPFTSEWLYLHKDDGILIVQETNCNLLRHVGVFFKDYH